MTLVIGLTGGIGCGKSAAAEMFRELGATIVDTDLISHRLTAPGGDALPAIRSAFGEEYVRSDGSLDRPRMRERVFSDPAAKTALEGILHPLIRARVQEELTAARGTAPYSILVVPLLFETGGYQGLVHRVAAVDCPEDVQVARTMVRSRLSEAEVRSIIAAQTPRSERLRRADDVISNNGDLAQLRRQVEALHERYLEMAQAGRQ